MAELPDNLKDALLALVKKVEQEDLSARQEQLKVARKCTEYWHGRQHLYWDESQMDWRVPTHEALSGLLPDEQVSFAYQHVINVFKPHGESIIAALASDVPQVQFGPKNVEDPDDDLAQKVADSAAHMIAEQNKVHLLIIYALYLLLIEGFCASYSYHHKDEKYGEVKIPEYGLEKRKPVTYVCETCGIVRESNGLCPKCQQELSPIEGEEEEVPVIKGTKLVPKGRERIEVYGLQDVSVASFAKEPEDIGYLILYKDVHPAQVMEVHGVEVGKGKGDESEHYTRFLDSDSPLVTVKYCWFLPWMFNSAEEEVRGELKKAFPKGCYFASCQESVIDWRAERLRDHWKIMKAGPSRGVHADPLLKSGTSLQDIRNNMINFLLMQIEYGVPASYASTSVMDFDGQKHQEQLPGYTYPVGPIPPGRRLEDFFYTERSTTVPGEAAGMVEGIDKDLQFVFSSFPSVYGGASTGGSKTLGEYEKSRSYALQRLALVWYYLTSWWGETIHTSVKSFATHQIEDEFWTSRIGGEIQTTWIKQADFKGSFVRIEPEVSTSIPITFDQKRGVLMELAGMNSEEINEVLYSPENARVVASYVGLKELKIPGEIQRARQMREIVTLLQGGEEGGVPPVPVSDDIDEHEIHIEVLRNFLAGTAGQELVNTRPKAFIRCIEHLREHKEILIQRMSFSENLGEEGGETEEEREEVGEGI